MAPIVFLCFFLSGASSLIFEMVWTRELTLVFGSTTLAISTVLSVFMGGLALGSWLAGRWADRVGEPIRGYAIAEVCVGVYALAVPAILLFYPSLTPWFGRLAGNHALVLALLRFVATAVLLLLPTTLMGATLPLLSRHLIRRPRDFGNIGARVGALYSINTFGAVLGTAVSGFLLLPDLGVRATNLCAALTNVSLFVLILAARRYRLRHPLPDFDSDEDLTPPPPQEEPLADHNALPASDSPAARPLQGFTEDAPPSLEPSRPTTPPSPTPPSPTPPSPTPPSPLTRRVVLGSFFLSGATAMVYQVLWSRALAIVIGSSVYSFTLILLAFLIGLAVGAALVARLAARTRRPLVWLALTQLGVLLMVGLSMVLIDKLPATFIALLKPSGDQASQLTVDDILFYQFVLAALPILPATFFMGGVLPLTIRVLSTGWGTVGSDVGGAYSINTLGAIVGSFAAGFLVLPLLGLDKGLRLAAVSSAVVVTALFLVCEARRRTRITVAALTALASLIAARTLPRWDLEHFQAGLFRVSIAKDIVESGKWAIPQLLYYKDGIATTVSVERWGKHIALKNNGKVDASNGDDMPTQIMVGLMPLLFHPTALDKPPTLAVIGYGSGVTVGATTQFPIAHADVVELEPAVVLAAHFFDDVNHQPDRNPKVSILVDDGRNFLAQGRRGSDAVSYDVIISEPSNPWITGVSNLFTRDYWQMARARLKDDGVFCQWAQLYELTPQNVKIILHTFSQVFPYTYVFSAEDLSSDLILVAANHPLQLDRARLARNFENPILKQELIRGDVRSVEDLFAYLLLTPDELPAFTAGVPTNTDDNAWIEFNAPKDLLASMRQETYIARVYGETWPYGRFESYLTGMGEGKTHGENEARIAESLIAHGKRTAAIRFAHYAMAHDGAAAAKRATELNDLLGVRGASDPEVPLFTDQDPPDAPTVPKNLSEPEIEKFARDYSNVEDQIRHHNWAHALRNFTSWPERYVEEAGKDLQLVLGYLLYKAEMEDEAVDRLKPLSEDPEYVKRRPAVLYYLGRSFYGESLYQAGVREMKKYQQAVGTMP